MRTVRRRAGRPPRGGQQHQGEQAVDLGLVGQQIGQEPAQADRLDHEVLPPQLGPGRGGVALVEDEVDDRQDRTEAVGQLGLVGYPVRDPGVADLALGPHQALGHGRLGDEEGPGDVGGLQAAQQPEGERHLRLAPRAPGGSR